MRFLPRALLELTTTVLGLISVSLGYSQPNSILIVVVGATIALIAFVILVDDVRNHYEEKGDFQKKIVQEALDIVYPMVTTTDSSLIAHPNWETKTEGFKRDILSHDDYELWKQFYDGIEERNEYLRPRMGPNWEILPKYNRAIFESFLKVYNEISWVRESIPKEQITNIQMRAKHTAAL
jgi:hypothetical protein